jgi:hypothetical protein
MTSILALALLASNPADAFCGTYVGPAGSSLKNRVSTMVMVREGNRTTVTMANDVAGGIPSFGMLIPVPGDVEDVHLLDDLSLMNRVDRYAGPRLVEYSCDDLRGGGVLQSACGGLMQQARELATRTALEHAGAALGDVTFGYGDYDVEVLTPSSVAELAGWATGAGWTLNSTASDVLDEYIGAGTRFIAVSVDLDEVMSGGVWLRPLQFTYTSDSMSLPVQLGALHSPGLQDVVLHVITDRDQGSVGVSNYPEFGVESECLVRGEGAGVLGGALGGGFDDFYANAVADGFEESGGGAAWTTEYTWAPAKCDPCPDEGPLDDEVLSDLGFEGDPSRATLTRIRARFAPGALHGDLGLYESGIAGQLQRRYVVHDASLEADFPVCGEGWVDGGGSCAVDTGSGGSPIPAGGPALPLGALLAGLGLLIRRTV